MPDSMPSAGIGHKINKIDSDFFWVDFMFCDIYEDSSSECPFFTDIHGIEGMSIEFSFSVSHLKEYKSPFLLHDDINLSSLYLEIPLNQTVSFWFEIFECNIFSSISETTTRYRHTTSCLSL